MRVEPEETQLEGLLAGLPSLDQQAMQAARNRQERLVKPPGSLGRLESLSIQIAGITGQPSPRLRQKCVIVMAADHGVAREGVSAYPQEVTAQMVANFLAGRAAINVLARHVGARLVVVDMGVASDLPPHPQLIVRKIACGTGNIAAGPAMSRAQALQAILAGAEIAGEQLRQGCDLLALGEMGIGNTTPAAAIAACLTGLPPVQVTGRGTGLVPAEIRRKVGVVEQALQANRPDPADGLEVLAKLGGFEIAGLVGVILAGAANRRPVVLDGFITTAAAMIAVALCRPARDYLIASHCSPERGHRRMLDWLGLEPLLDLQMRLGEGTGAALAFSLIEAACRLLAEMATFEEAGVSTKRP